MKKSTVLRLTILSVTVTAAIVISKGVYYGGQAERNLHAVICTASAIEHFVSETKRWPLDWQELANFKNLSIAPSMYQLPNDLYEVRTRVTLRFDIRDGHDLDRIKPISPNGPCFDYQRYIDRMRSTIQQIQWKQTTASDGEFEASGQ